MNLKCIAASVAILSSGAAFAGVTGNVGAVNEYLFRGVEQSNGSALQGGLDYAHDSGFYAGTWISNVSFANTTQTGTVSYETDVYGGWSHKFNDWAGLDAGLLYYFYRDDTAYNTLEGYVALLLGSGALKAYYTPSYFGAKDANGDDAAGLYLTAYYPFTMDSANTITLTPQVGYSSGDGPKAYFGNDASGNPDGEYLDYSLTLAKALDSGLSLSLAVVGTNLDTNLYPNDKEKLVIGLKKTFSL